MGARRAKRGRGRLGLFSEWSRAAACAGAETSQNVQGSRSFEELLVEEPQYQKDPDGNHIPASLGFPGSENKAWKPLPQLPTSHQMEITLGTSGLCLCILRVSYLASQQAVGLGN